MQNWIKISDKSIEKKIITNFKRFLKKGEKQRNLIIG
jgi:hypothetical protein